ncbi:hypothetical protein [Nonomuraea sp. NPDC005650]|uniref:hypothetical protein n=1 Tax=Nonomuraea sp. NPDC005650 TaxID=3157045 RepID=UPI0033AD016B
MSEVVPLPSFGEVFFDARGQERCLRVTWHEGTLVLSLWRGEMCTASFRMPMEDVGRLLDTLDEGFAEATGEQPAVPAQEPGTEVMPGTGQYQRPAQPIQQPPQHQPDERPTAALSPNDVLVARGTPPARQDKLVASYGETTAPRDSMPPAPPAYGEPPRESPAYGERAPFTGPQYVETTAPQQRYTGDPLSGPQQYAGDPFSGPQQYGGDPLSGPQQYAGDPFSGPQQYGGEPAQYGNPAGQPDPYAGPQYDNEPVYQMPGDQRRPAPLSTDPLGFPSQAAAPHQQPQHQQAPHQQHQQPQHQQVQHQHQQAPHQQQAQYPADPYAADPYPADPYPADPYARRPDAYQQPPQAQATPGLGTPMHGIPGAGRPRPAPQPVHDDYAAYQQNPGPSPVDPLMSMGRPEHQQPDALSRPYVGDPMFSTGERLRPDQQPDYYERSDRREW